MLKHTLAESENRLSLNEEVIHVEKHNVFVFRRKNDSYKYVKNVVVLLKRLLSRFKMYV